MRRIRISILIAIAVLLAGCSVHTLPQRTYELTSHDNPSPLVVLTELVEHSGGGDCPRYDPDRILARGWFQAIPGSNLQLDKPAASSGTVLLGMHFWEQEARWTIFQPGCVVLTVYPEGWALSDLADSPRDARQATLGSRQAWSPDFWAMSPSGVLIGQPFPTACSRVSFQLPARKLRPSTQPIPSDPLSAVDAANLAEQIEVVRAFVQDESPKVVRRDGLQIVLKTIDEEILALRQAKVDSNACDQLDEQSRLLHRLIK